MNSIIFLDTETTGNEQGVDHLFQVAYKDHTGFHVEYFTPPLPISVKAQSITHVTNEDIEGKPVFVGSEYAQDLQKKLNDGVLVAHNAQFDVGMLKTEGIEVPRYICTLKLARFLDDTEEVPEYNLQFLRYYFALKVKAMPHDAEGDVVVLEKVFEKLREIWQSKFGQENDIEKMVEVSTKPLLMRRINFGKHAGKSVEEIAKIDPSYLFWLLGEKKKKPAGEEDWIYTLEYYLIGK